MNNAKPVHWPSVLQLGLSLAASLLLGVGGGLLILMGAIQLSQEGLDSQQAVQTFMLAASLLLGGGLILPSAWYAWQRLQSAPHVPPGFESKPVLSSPLPRQRHRLLILISIILMLLALLAGDWVARNHQLAWLWLPGLNLLVVGLPVLWLVLAGKQRLPGGSLQRQWGIFAGGLVISPGIILTIELLALLGIGFLVVLAAALNPSMGRELSFLVYRLAHATPDMEDLLNLLSPYLLRPTILAGIFAYTAVLVPLIEEAFKPIGLWLLAGRQLTPAEGFVGGLLSGAGFALFENLGATSAGGETWAILAVSRTTTALLHILTTGLTGWALSLAFSRRRYLQLGLTYAGVVILHGLWNALGIASFALPQLEISSFPPADLELYGSLVMVGLGAMAGVNLLLYLSFSRRLGRAVVPSPAVGDPQTLDLGQDPGLDPLPEPPLAPPAHESPLGPNQSSN